MAEIAAHEEEELDEEHSDADEQEANEDEDEEDEGAKTETEEAAEPTPTNAAPGSTEPLTLESLSLADQPPHPPTSDPEHDEDDEAEAASHSDAESDGSLAPSMADTLSHRRHRPSARRTAPDVSAIVTNRLAKTKASSERKHHGKKQATSNVLGRNKGSKAKQSQTRAIKDGGDF